MSVGGDAVTVDGLRASHAVTWLLAVTGMACEIVFPFLVVIDRSNLWTVLLGWPLGMLLAWLVARRRGLSREKRRAVMNYGFAAIFVVMFARDDAHEAGRM
ncbi:hypothetical protein [Micromonospora sp. NBRC 101691]|uniref:hypothetical protein n=1 Tax=Micromonospora sp. NBRC 101691 TaxID=3032198 RepID=UPI0024A5CF9A|nr:hypothetical protein [Micromonospora sp. NBRC 101691]GLY21595.1 hypothetical protein Misp04_13270 [Micromonospora sp. NBRC 101691]